MSDNPSMDNLSDDRLPDDLASLAEQLEADALALASSYPAGAPQKWLSVSQEIEITARQQGRRTMWTRAVAAVVLVGAGLGLSYWGSARWLAWHEVRPQTVEHIEPAHAGPAENIVHTMAEPAVTEESQGPASQKIPAVFFESLSSPEQEALLDLMESEGLEQSSLSI